MPQGPAPTCECIGGFPPLDVLRWIYCVLQQINTNTGGDASSNQFTSSPGLTASSGSIPAGVLGWSITAVSGTITVNGTSLPVGASVAGGGYDGRTLATAIPYTVAGGTALVTYDTPA